MPTMPAVNVGESAHVNVLTVVSVAMASHAPFVLANTTAPISVVDVPSLPPFILEPAVLT
jgi:hypothetical protein